MYNVWSSGTGRAAAGQPVDGGVEHDRDEERQDAPDDDRLQPVPEPQREQD